LLSTVNSSKHNCYYIIEIFFLQNLISRCFFNNGVSLYLFSHCRSKQWQTQSCVIEIFLLSPVIGNGISIYLSLSNYLLSSIQLSVLVPYQLSTQNVSNISKKGIPKLDTSLLDSAVPLHRQVTSGHCSTRFLTKIYLTVHIRIIRPKYSCEYRAPDQPSFLCLASTSP